MSPPSREQLDCYIMMDGKYATRYHCLRQTGMCTIPHGKFNRHYYIQVQPNQSFAIEITHSTDWWNTISANVSFDGIPRVHVPEITTTKFTIDRTEDQITTKLAETRKFGFGKITFAERPISKDFEETRAQVLSNIGTIKISIYRCLEKHQISIDGTLDTFAAAGMTCGSNFVPFVNDPTTTSGHNSQEPLILDANNANLKDISYQVLLGRAVYVEEAPWDTTPMMLDAPDRAAFTFYIHYRTREELQKLGIIESSNLLKLDPSNGSDNTRSSTTASEELPESSKKRKLHLTGSDREVEAQTLEDPTTSRQSPADDSFSLLEEKIMDGRGVIKEEVTDTEMAGKQMLDEPMTKG